MYANHITVIALNVSEGNCDDTFAVASPSGNITLEKPVNDPHPFYLLVEAIGSHHFSTNLIQIAFVKVTVNIQADCHATSNSATFFPMSYVVWIIALLVQALQ